jgi:hypothetical protein
MRSIVALPLLLALGCAQDSVAGSQGGYAVVQGHVSDALGGPVAGADVDVRCTTGSVQAQILTDPAGRYQVHLDAVAVPISPARSLDCRFRADVAGATVADRHASVMFTTAPALAALQTIDLVEPTVP